MAERPGRILLVFLDGVGIGEGDPARNPFHAVPLPSFRRLFGGSIPSLPLEQGVQWITATRAWVAADATLGIEGRPQSGTGQVTLFTGTNAAARLGRHFGPWVHTALRDMLEGGNLLVRAREQGRRVAFANAYPPGALGFHSGSERRPAAPPLVARSAAALTRGPEQLRRGEAVASSLDNEAWRQHLDASIPTVTVADAGRILAGIAAGADLTLFAHYDTDAAGHRQEMAAATTALQRVDHFLGALLDALPPDCLLAVTSDHGNVEDVTTGHTRNPVPVLLQGPGSEVVARSVSGIGDVAPALLRELGIGG